MPDNVEEGIFGEMKKIVAFLFIVSSVNAQQWKTVNGGVRGGGIPQPTIITLYNDTFSEIIF